MSGLTIDNPITLSKVLASQRIVPGDVLTLADGVYTGKFIFGGGMTGAVATPITIKAANRLQAKIDGTLITGGANVIIQDIEFTHLGWTSRKVPWVAAPNLYTAASTDLKIRNCLIHDGAECVEAFGSGPMELYGCVLYNGGLIVDGEGVGHTIYTHNAGGGLRRFENNIWLASMNYGFHAHSSGNNKIDNYHLLNNIFGKCNAKNTFGNDSGIEGAIVKRIVFEANENMNTWWWMNRWTTPGEDITIINNWFDGNSTYGRGCFQFKTMSTLNCKGNTLVHDDGLVVFKYPDTKTAYTWNNNAYYGKGGNEFTVQYPRAADYVEQDYGAWKKGTGFDAASTYNAYPPANRVRVIPNTYDEDICHVAIYNYALADSVAVDVSAVYPDDTVVKAHQAQDYWGDVQTLTVADGQIVIDMRAEVHSMVKPIGYDANIDPLMCPKYGAFVVERYS